MEVHVPGEYVLREYVLGATIDSSINGGGEYVTEIPPQGGESTCWGST